MKYVDYKPYMRGRACGREEYRNGHPCDPASDSPDWSTGYIDGWMSAQDEAIATHGVTLATQLSWRDGGVAAHEAAAR